MGTATANSPDTIGLIGMPGAGKSTTGVLLAKLCGLRFVDTDLDIQVHAGATLQQILERDGHLQLRTLEQEVLLGVDLAGAVIATGGGAVIDPLSRWAMWDAGLSIWLDAPDDRLAERLRRSGEPRPLVAGDVVAALAAGLPAPILHGTATLARAVSIPVIASGGVSSLADLIALRDTGVISGAISGRALYDGAIDLKEALKALKA